MVLILDEPPMRSSFVQAVRRNAWPMLRPISLRDALVEIHYRRPEVVATQLASATSPGLRFITTLRRRRELPLLVVAAAHSANLESAARAAGATTYLPDDAGPDEITSVVRRLLRRAMETSTAGITDGQRMRFDPTGPPGERRTSRI
jgi:DNA-binding response OmpR family regulator